MYFDEEFELSHSSQGSERVEASTRTARRRHERGSQVVRGYHTSIPPSTKSQWTTFPILGEGWRKNLNRFSKKSLACPELFLLYTE
jgi:hypothetical protein